MMIYMEEWNLTWLEMTRYIPFVVRILTSKYTTWQKHAHVCCLYPKDGNIVGPSLDLAILLLLVKPMGC